ncbi:MAG TPA: hypothetical protein DCL44_10985 [Elusimicrobia bacterium]|nr:hypothetical protein [Elusimicrobiota bacterium]
MRRFIIKLLIFLAPIFVVLACAEIRLGKVKNSYNTKLALLKNIPGCEALFLGSSHALRAFNPEFFSHQSFNMGNTSQSLYHDSRILMRFAPILPKLKVVVFPISYFSLEYNLETALESWRTFFYRQYYGIPANNWAMRCDIRNYSKVALYGQNAISNQIFYFIDALLPISAKGLLRADSTRDLPLPNLSANGWMPCEGAWLPIDKTGKYFVEQHHNVMREKFRQSNIRYLRKSIEFSLQRGITPMLVTLPVSYTYSNHIDKSKYLWMQERIRGLCTEYHIRYLNYFTDRRFGPEDFSDPDHLNSKGSEKLSRILNKEISPVITDGK